MTKKKVTDIQVFKPETNKVQLVESWIFALSSRNFSIFAERLLLRLVQVAQVQVLGADFKGGESIGQVSIGSLGDARVEIPIKGLLSDGTNNYTQAREAILELMHSPYFVERPKMRNGRPVYNEDGTQMYEFVGHQILNNCSLNIKPGYAIVDVNAETWRAMLDFSKGFRKFDLETALRLKLVSSFRIFPLLSNQKSPITMTIDQLHRLWKIDERDPDTGKYLVYPDTYSFIKRMVEPAKQELDEKSAWSFNYVKNYADDEADGVKRRGKKAVTSITFIPVHRIVQESGVNLVRMTSTAVSELGRETYDMMVNKFEFTPKGLSNNVPLFHAARKVGMDVDAFVRSIAPSALRADNPPGFVINAIRKRLKEYYGVTVEESVSGNG